MEPQNEIKKAAGWIRTSITARMFMVGFLILVLLIPLIFIQDLIRERANRRGETISEINRKWGNDLILQGPVLKVPYKVYTESIKFDPETQKSVSTQTAYTQFAYFFPEDLTIDAKTDAVKKGYGIYETSVYSADMKIKGSFGVPNFKIHDIPEGDIQWDKATILIQTSNLKGIKNEMKITIGAQSFVFVPKYRDEPMGLVQPVLQNLESEYLPTDVLPREGHIPFSLEMVVNGSGSISFVPVGKETHVTMNSNWTSPSFSGNFLPEEDGTDKVRPDGFTAHWNIYQINRQFEQQFFEHLPDLREFAFGAELIVTLDEYLKSERSTKYGFLVITLTFLVFFLIQTMSKIDIHPFQYLMIGLALTMFYTLLISISEHQTFLKGYIIAGVSVLALITFYSKTILRSWKFPLFILVSLTSLYSFILVIIQLENYALLVGSVGLFVILAMIMFFSRKIDWQQG